MVVLASVDVLTVPYVLYCMYFVFYIFFVEYKKNVFIPLSISFLNKVCTKTFVTFRSKSIGLVT